jgi:hypothetical protein
MAVDGLKLVFTIEKTTYTLLLSTDTDDIFKFLQLDITRFHNGFKNENELFDYIFESPYILYTILSKKFVKIKPDSRLHVISQYKPKIDNINIKAIDIADIKNKALQFFNKNEEYDNMISSIEKKNALSRKFNGNIVMKTLDNKIQGKELGIFINKFKAINDIEKMTEEEIIIAIRNMNIF